MASIEFLYLKHVILVVEDTYVYSCTYAFTHTYMNTNAHMYAHTHTQIQSGQKVKVQKNINKCSFYKAFLKSN